MVCIRFLAGTNSGCSFSVDSYHTSAFSNSSCEGKGQWERVLPPDWTHAGTVSPLRWWQPCSIFSVDLNRWGKLGSGKKPPPPPPPTTSQGRRTRGKGEAGMWWAPTMCQTHRARNREMKSSVFPKEQLVWGKRQILQQNIIKWGENVARKIGTGHHDALIGSRPNPEESVVSVSPHS